MPARAFQTSARSAPGVAGLAFDIGRFDSEKRFLQNAADSGALAVANALIRGESVADAEAEGRDVLARNLASSPSGTAATVATTPQYATGHSGDEDYLTSGILIDSSGDVRVAVYDGPVTTEGRIELLPFLHEQAVSITAHRFGNPDKQLLALKV